MVDQKGGSIPWNSGPGSDFLGQAGSSTFPKALSGFHLYRHQRAPVDVNAIDNTIQKIGRTIDRVYSFFRTTPPQNLRRRALIT